jgi:hypothetical protein
MARKTRAELKDVIRAQRGYIEELEMALRIERQNITEVKRMERARTEAVARRCSAALDALANIATYVHNARRDVTGA